MSKLPPALVIAFGLFAAPLAGPTRAAALGPHPGQCEGRHPAMLVRVVGLRDRRGTVRVQSYGGDPATFLDKGSYLERVDVAPPEHGAVEICMPVPGAGVYAVSVRHLTEGGSDMDDGGGVSGNPHRSTLDLLFRRKPAPDEMSIRVAGVVTVPVVMNYLQGGSFKPVDTAER